MSKHTPGPWRIDEWGDIVAGLRDIAETAHIWNDGGDDTLPEMRRANARLIAAAPDLLAACTALVAQCGQSYCPLCGAYLSPAHGKHHKGCAVALAAAAIAAAEEGVRV